ncbi:MAG: helix-turn-helix domain-containing protein [Mycobacterium sp.]
MTLPKVERTEGVRQASSPPTERVIAVVELLAAESRRGLSLTQIARTLGISRATAHAILATLVDHRWAVRDEHTGGYSWGPGLPAVTMLAAERPFHAVLRDLYESTGVQVFVARRESSTIMVLDSVGEAPAGSPIRPGLRLPLVAPFGRDYLAWSTDEDRDAWLAGIGSPTPELTQRFSDVLAEIRHRGYVIERLTREYVRVYTALQALSVDGQPDVITARLAGAFADLALVDFLPGELRAARIHPVASVSSPIRGRAGVTMSITVAPFAGITGAEIKKLGEHVRAAAARIEATRYTE